MEMPAAEINSRTVEAISGVETEPGHPAVVEAGEVTPQEELEAGVEPPVITASSRRAMPTGVRVLRLVAMVEDQHLWEEVSFIKSVLSNCFVFLTQMFPCFII